MSTPIYDELEEKWNAVGSDLDYLSGLQTDCVIRDYPNYVADTLVCVECSAKTRKRKLFGRNSQCDGCV